MKQRKATLFFNPQAGYGRKKKFFQKKTSHQAYYKTLLNIIKHELESYNFKLTIILITQTINTTDILKNITKKNTDIVIAAGGDGTINHIINGLIISSIPLGIIPIGSVNVLALDLGISTNIKEACHQIAHGTLKKIDIGKANNNYFSSMAGIGFDAKVIKHTPIEFKKKHGLLSFVYIAFKVLSTYKYHPIHIKINNDPTFHKAYFVIINNSKYYGGKFVISPQSSLTDGQLDITMLKKGNLTSLFHFLKHLIFGTLSSYKEVHLIQGSSVSLKENEKHHTHVDAEYIGKTHVKISIIPKGLTLIY